MWKMQWNSINSGSHPLREDVSWNANWNMRLTPAVMVILFVRMWVEMTSLWWYTARHWSSSSWGCELKYYIGIRSARRRVSSSSWGCELKYFRAMMKYSVFLSSSSWGCELKYISWLRKSCTHVILFVRMWVEIVTPKRYCLTKESSSSWGCELKCPRLLLRLWNFPSSSSWGCELKWLIPQWWTRWHLGHPLREDVSWNINAKATDAKYIGSSSSWGCELKYFNSGGGDVFAGHPLREDVSWNIEKWWGNRWDRVILFVRMWVEMILDISDDTVQDVILFVRMWVEILWRILLSGWRMSSSSWGCELKYSASLWLLGFRPSSSSWGCELKFQCHDCVFACCRHPLREDVSWNLEEYGVNHRCSNMVLLVGRWIEMLLWWSVSVLM